MATLSRTVWRLLGALILTLSAGTAGAEDLAPPQQVIRDTSQQLQSVLREERKLLLEDPAYVYRLADEVFVPRVDMARVSSLVLGRYWRTATPQQRQAFGEEFKRLLARTYASALRELGDWELRFLPLRMGDESNRALVKTQILRSGAPPLAVDYSMHESEGRWLAYDVKIEGVSLITNYRSSFARLIQTKGMAGLIDELEKKNSERLPAALNKVAKS
jgi:phospholipid transport system substrate-binding protein